MEDFEREYADELEMMTEESAHSAGPPSRRSLDFCSPALPRRKRSLSSESPLPTVSSAPPYKVRCVDKSHESELPPTQPQVTPTRPFVAFGSIRPSKFLPTTGHDGTVTCSPPCSPPLAIQTSDHNSQSPCNNDVMYTTPTKQEKENAKQTPSSTSKYQRALAPPESPNKDHSKKSNVSIVEKFNAVYRTLTTQPVTDDFEDEVVDDSYSPVLERRSTMEVVAPSSGVLTRAPASPHITVTASDGRRVYLKMQQSKQLSQSSLSIVSGCLLPVSFSQLRSAVREERRRRLIEQAEQVLNSLKSSVESESRPLLKDSEMTEEDGPKTKQSADNLWVDKYAPRHYTHLLSDDLSG
ncbi:Chromosome transmission fidelity protein 18 homolog [Geodia barretti]|uniref:Chromosome transmission fidelity protein 18 homolog n=1 Tax=Geodia barretti TaxID=519541 RepID=A0AA35X2L4_GEOBA|nr:Chromosome transmission fidelity protein 18 homolog [Geodia barretti]